MKQTLEQFNGNFEATYKKEAKEPLEQPKRSKLYFSWNKKKPKKHHKWRYFLWFSFGCIFITLIYLYLLNWFLTDHVCI